MILLALMSVLIAAEPVQSELNMTTQSGSVQSVPAIVEVVVDEVVNPLTGEYYVYVLENGQEVGDRILIEEGPFGAEVGDKFFINLPPPNTP